MELLKSKEGLTENKAEEIRKIYEPMVNMLLPMEDEFNQLVKLEVNDLVMKEARDLRLRIAKVRIAGEKEKTKAKKGVLAVGNAIQGAYNTLVYATKSKEEKLLDIEKTYERREQLRIDNLQDERANDIRGLVDVVPGDLGGMSDEVWNNFLTGCKSNYEEKQKAIKKEEERKEREEKVRLLNVERSKLLFQYGNFLTDEEKEINFGELDDDSFKSFLSRLKDLSDKEEESKKLFNERVDLVRNLTAFYNDDELKRNLLDYTVDGFDKLLIDLKNRKVKRDIEDQKKKEEDDRIKKQLQEEKKKREQVERDLKERERKEEEDKKRAYEKEQLELSKGDKDKFDNIIEGLDEIRFKHSFKAQSSIKLSSDIENLIEKVINHVNKKVEEYGIS